MGNESAVASPAGINPALAAAKWLSELVDRLSIYAIVAFMAIMTASIFIQVIFRYVLNAPLSWTEEVSRYLMIWVCFLGSAMAVKRGEHIGVSFIRDRFPRKMQAVVGVVIGLAVLFFVGLSAYTGTIMTIQVVSQLTPATRISMAWAYASIPIGCLFMTVHALANLLEDPSKSGVISTVS